MDRIAIISDIHGNLPALHATLDDIAARGITRIVCLGDLVGKGPHSDQATDICRAACEATFGDCTPAAQPPSRHWKVSIQL